ncbi:hypothetical protein PROFUN_06203 [Planoprotostelium fungivorum]|uniref:LRR receptor-like serine/threonine-protein kinase n=1 Tax=Planoprotostelium fungivorum TaxID=1890364 RepID=A0A2P6MYY7_9EUKA|nr:hypothetical protein PROFUN_06203 [Planoprotostelium fungivorum]
MRSSSILLLCLMCCFITVEADTLATLKSIWKTLNGNSTLWIGNDFCNGTDFRGVTCQNGALIRIEFYQPGPWAFTGYLSPLIANLTTLQVLAIQAGMNGGVPSAIGNLPNLLILNLGINQLTGGIPDAICRLNQLSRLNLGTNRLEGNIPPCIAGMTSLTELFLDHNSLNGTIPTNLGSLLQLNQLTLHNNNLTGVAPSSLASLNLRELWLSNNDLTGDLSTWPVGNNFMDLTTLRINDNRFSGPIPGWISSTLISVLMIENNRFSGTIPSSIFKMGLTSFTANNNQLEGNIPKQLTTMNGLQTLDLSGNRFNGSIPSTIGDMKYLLTLNLYSNQLTGNIPSSIGDLTLQYLDLSDNQLTGSIPSSIGNLTGVYSIDLEVNNLTGVIPNSIGKLNSLEYFNADGNRVEGPLPNQICSLASLQTFTMRNNLINGSIPSCWSVNQQYLTYIDLSGNRLSGSIPYSISNLHALYSLDLHGNQLSGPIPALIDVPSFSLDLSNNLLNGSLASGWKTVQINASHNQLTGQVPTLMSQYIDLSYNRFNSIAQGPYLGGTICDLTFNEFPCVPAQPSGRCKMTCQTSVDQIYNSNSSLSATAAQTVLNQATVSVDELPGILSALTSVLLKNSSSFSLRTNDSSLYVNTYSVTSTASLSVTLPNTSISAVFPSSSISSREQISVAVSSISSNPFASIDNTTTYGNVIGVTVYDREREVDVTGTELINITMGILPSSFPSSAEAECLWWQETEERWQREGCNATVRADEVIVCQCNHLTNFTLGVKPAQAAQSDASPAQPNTRSQNTMIIIAACTAGGGLLLIIVVSLIVYFVLRGKRSSNGVNMAMRAYSDVKMKIEYEDVLHDGRCKIWKGKLDEITTVAIKKAKEKKREKELIVEATTLKGMHHPNIILYIGQDLAEGYYVMEYMNGGSLQQYMVKQALNASSIYIIGADVARGLSYLTFMNTTHIHLSPQKILLSITDGQISAKITGLNLTRSINSQADPDTFGVYTAPEVIESGTYQAGSDVWSFGVLLFAMVTNDVHLYDEHNQKEMVKRTKVGGQSYVVARGADETISTLITQCTRREVELRLAIQDVMGRLCSEQATSGSSLFQGQKDIYGLVHM